MHQNQTENNLGKPVSDLNTKQISILTQNSESKDTENLSARNLLAELERLGLESEQKSNEINGFVELLKEKENQVAELTARVHELNLLKTSKMETEIEVSSVNEKSSLDVISNNEIDSIKMINADLSNQNMQKDSEIRNLNESLVFLQRRYDVFADHSETLMKSKDDHILKITKELESLTEELLRMKESGLNDEHFLEIQRENHNLKQELLKVSSEINSIQAVSSVGEENEKLRAKLMHLESIEEKSQNELSIMKSQMILKGLGKEFDSARIIADWQFKFQQSEWKLKETESKLEEVLKAKMETINRNPKFMPDLRRATDIEVKLATQMVDIENYEIETKNLKQKIETLNKELIDKEKILQELAKSAASTKESQKLKNQEEDRLTALVNSIKTELREYSCVSEEQSEKIFKESNAAFAELVVRGEQSLKNNDKQLFENLDKSHEKIKGLITNFSENKGEYSCSSVSSASSSKMKAASPSSGYVESSEYSLLEENIKLQRIIIKMHHSLKALKAKEQESK